MSAAAIAQQYQNGAIYVLLFSRGAEPGFHWGIWVPAASPDGQFWHATNRSGGWELKTHEYRAPESISLCLAFKVGTASDWSTFTSTLEAIPADGRPSQSGQKFSCRTWVQDSLTSLHANKVIVLTQSIAELEDWAIRTAERYRNKVESGRGPAGVFNEL